MHRRTVTGKRACAKEARCRRPRRARARRDHRPRARLHHRAQVEPARQGPRLSREPRARTSGISRIVVVDNGSRDGSAAAIRARFPAVTALPLPKNRGYAGGNNASCGSPSSTAPRRFSCDVAGPREALSARAARARDPRQADGPWSPRSRGTITRSDGAARGLERAPSRGSSDRLVRCDRPHVHATWYVETYVQTAARLVVRGKADVGVAPFVARLGRRGTEEHRRFP